MQDPHRDSDIPPEITERDHKGQPKRKESLLSFLGELPVLIITAVIVAWLIKTLVIQPFYIPSSSMEPTLFPGDRVLVSKFIYRFQPPKAGDIVVFVSPENRTPIEQDFIKRVVATEGMTVEVSHGQLFVNGQKQKEPYIKPDNPVSQYEASKVPKGKVFVMGDNRANSKDSRFFGPISTKKLLGKAFLIYWPPSRLGRLE